MTTALLDDEQTGARTALYQSLFRVKYGWRVAGQESGHFRRIEMSRLNHHVMQPSDSTALFLANHQRFLDFLKSRVGSTHDAEEILQAAFVRVMEKGSSIRQSESSIAWFYRLLRNAVIDYYRRRESADRSLEAYAQQLDEFEHVVDATLEQTICACVRGLIPTLKPEYATLIEAVDLQDQRLPAVATAMGIAPGNARVRLHRARMALRQQLERTCRTCAAHGCLDCTCSHPRRDSQNADASSMG
jgi:RNA polymerase sigma-70 factor (ECF subfamily)